MQDYRWLWGKNPKLYVAIEIATYAVFETPERETSVVRLENEDEIIAGEILPRSTSFRYRIRTRFENRLGESNFFDQYDPAFLFNPNFIGEICELEEALRRAIDNKTRDYMRAYRQGTFFKNPAGIAWCLNDCDKLYPPSQFGLSIPSGSGIVRDRKYRL